MREWMAAGKKGQVMVGFAMVARSALKHNVGAFGWCSGEGVHC